MGLPSLPDAAQQSKQRLYWHMKPNCSVTTADHGDSRDGLATIAYLKFLFRYQIYFGKSLIARCCKEQH